MALPSSHEDDPERAVRAGSRILSTIGTANKARRPEELSVRVGIETGPAVVGSFGTGAGYGAVGEVVGAAAAVQSAAKAGSVLVGPVTRAATGAAFERGPTEDVVPSPGAKPVVASYLERPTARPASYRGQRRLAGHAPLVGRQAELAVLDDAVREATSGTGSVVFIVGEPGLGKTRLVDECRKRFMAWVGAGTGRLPLWLEGRAASYASSTPYGLYQQLLSAWVGTAPEEGEEVFRVAMERAMKAVFGGQVDHAAFLAHMMGLPAGPATDRLARFSPEGLQRATFAAVRALVERLAARGPTVLVLEDLHWADPISLRLTEELAVLTGNGPLFVLLTRRPEPDAGVSALEGALANGSCRAAQDRAIPFGRRCRACPGPVPRRGGRRQGRHRRLLCRRRGEPALFGGTTFLVGRDGRVGEGQGHLAHRWACRYRDPRCVGTAHTFPGGPARPRPSGHRHLGICPGPRI